MRNTVLIAIGALTLGLAGCAAPQPEEIFPPGVDTNQVLLQRCGNVPGGAAGHFRCEDEFYATHPSLGVPTTLAQLQAADHSHWGYHSTATIYDRRGTNIGTVRIDSY